MNEIIKKIPAVYQWLNRHDKEWLFMNSPEKRKRGGNITFASHDKTDSILSSQILKAATCIRTQTGKPAQISKKKIFSTIGCKEISTKELEDYPLTKKVILDVVENKDSYRIRKINWANDELMTQGLPVNKWRVMKLAGIRQELWDNYWS